MKIELSDKILNNVEKPARYIGGELNSVYKDDNEVDIRFAFCFPDVYEIGMSHLGMKILYYVLNKMDRVYCERVFAPWIDMENIMRKNDIPLFSIETKKPLKEFDILGFTLQYEMSYSNVVNMLDLSNIPLISAERKDDDPLVIAGGPCTYNPEPLADLIDIFILGEGEDVIKEVINLLKDLKNHNRERKIKEISKIKGVYVPSLYEAIYDNKVYKGLKPKADNIPKRVDKRLIKDLDSAEYPENLVVPFIDIVHDRVMLELFRGCVRGCRFCQAGMIYRPVREKSHETLLEQAEKLIDNTGYEEISLASLSTSDYTQLKDLSEKLIDITEKRNVNLSLPSLRIDNFSIDLMKKAQKVRKSGLTFAPEAGSQRLRDIINKNVTEEDLLKSARIAFEGGWNRIKLYFMIGLPFETDEDIEAIADLAYKVVDTYYSLPKDQRARGLNVTVSTSSFVPKPFTPFQWVAQNSIDELTRKQTILKNSIRSRRITYNWHEPKLSILEGVFSRGDRRLGKVLISANKKGCKFDGWNEHFKYESWLESFRENNIDINDYTKERNSDEILPWDHINPGVSKVFLKKEYDKAKKGKTTLTCRDKCSGCGVNSLVGGNCFE